MVTGQAGDGERGLSSVLGIVLMVAVTIILAAVVGVFVLGIGEQLTSESPQTNLEYSFGNDSVTILHGGGDELQTEEIIIRSGSTELWNKGTENGPINSSDGWSDGTITAADTIELTYDDSDDLNSGDQVIVVWTDGQRSAIIGEETVP